VDDLTTFKQEEHEEERQRLEQELEAARKTLTAAAGYSIT